MNKKLLTILTTILLFLIVGLITASAADNEYLGDIDNNGTITAADARAILRFSAKLDEFSAEQEKAADVDGNGTVNAADARITLRISAKLEKIEDYIKDSETTTEAPTTEEPTTEEPTTEEPTTEEPTTEEPTTEEPTTEAPDPVPVITADREKVQIYNGTSETVNITVENIDDYEIEISLSGASIDNPVPSSDMKYEVTKTSTGATVTLTANEVFIGDKTMILSVDVYKMGDLSTLTYLEIPVNVVFETNDISNGLSVKYLGDKDFVYDEEEDSYYFRFGLTSSSNTYLDTYGRLTLRIVNSDDVTVYSTTYDVTPDDFSNWQNLYITKYLFSLKIPASEITKGETEKGKVIFEFVTPWGSFSEASISVSNLPKHSILDDCSLELPETPVELSYYRYSGSVNTKFKVENITYEFEENYDKTVDVNIYFSGEKLYDDKGENYSNDCWFGYKLYDAEGYVVESGSVWTDSLKVGEKQKDIDLKIYDLEPGAYRLELLDVN